MSTKTREGLLAEAQPILQPYLEGTKLSKDFFRRLVEAAKNFPQGKAKYAAQGICLEEGLHHTTAEHFSKACRYLALLRTNYPEKFEQLVG